jgi:ADP-ribose pyrophosphatase YjhB (NUDIX family)
MKNNLFEDIKRLKTLADLGLLYANNDFDRERYEELYAISLRMMQCIGDHKMEDLKTNFPLSKDYPTAKVDIRGILITPDHKILLVRESTDGKWSLPGGWADVGHSPKETIVKEFFEETGINVEVQRLLAVFDKKMHPHPAQAFYVYKMVFYCVATSIELQKGFDILDVRFFDLEHLPSLSEDRILKSQIELLFAKIKNDDKITYFD